MDLDAIRARDAESPHFVVLDKSIRPSDWEVLERLIEPGISAMRDRRDLLAEVDRLTALLGQAACAPCEAATERARALPVIEAARAAADHLNEHGCDTGDALRAALARYEEVARG